MHLIIQIRNLFDQLVSVLTHLTNEQYTRQCGILSDATVGQHVRHILEHFVELDKGYTNGLVNYENRKRDHRIETDRDFTMTLLEALPARLLKPDRPLVLAASVDAGSEETVRVGTNYYRELLFNLEHAVHHMALLRIGVTDVAGISLPPAFGVAASTLKFRSVWAR